MELEIHIAESILSLKLFHSSEILTSAIFIEKMFYVLLERNPQNAYSHLAGPVNINLANPIFIEKCFMYFLENRPRNALSDLGPTIKKIFVSPIFIAFLYNLGTEPRNGYSDLAFQIKTNLVKANIH